MREQSDYLSTIDTMYPDGYARETFFRDSGDMVDPAAVRLAARGLMGRLLRACRLWAQKRNGRLALRDLDDDQLRDIGLTRAQAQREVSKSFFWD